MACKNVYKTCLPELIIGILEEMTEHDGMHLSQKAIGEELHRRYQYTPERQSLGRIINTLIREEELGCRGNAREGYWAGDEGEYCEGDTAVKLNDRKILAPCFLRRILLNTTNIWRPMSQEKLVRELEKYPWCLVTERRKVARDLEALMEIDPCICHSSEGYYACRKKLTE